MRGSNSGDEDNIQGDPRTEGGDAHVFSQPIGYIPQHPPPPKYIRVRHSFGSIGVCTQVSENKLFLLGSLSSQVQARLQQYLSSPGAVSGAVV